MGLCKCQSNTSSSVGFAFCYSETVDAYGDNLGGAFCSGDTALPKDSQKEISGDLKPYDGIFARSSGLLALEGPLRSHPLSSDGELFFTDPKPDLVRGIQTVYVS